MADAETVHYSITEVANMLEVPQHVLRMWECQFASISPVRGQNGRRAYTAETVSAVRIVQELLHEDGLTLAQARQKLKGYVSASTSSAPPTVSSVQDSLLDSSSGANATHDTAQLRAVLAALEIASAALAHQ
ncbi:MAG: MerR family transcriptional regulator [Alphaproteobacteria bacterium]|nr:MerR family transcriptional regulator [Alphaproteobacteria bacterium]